ncbi:ParB/RepB/Spo0J family partition protein [Antribacter gilvus]|uniref:ParB/RepB/Spo0J family partition protein n=1 Tax=Antribacter gilvus TaxID=2304675 RepID=UPI000F7B3B1C|nr:ParB/RepB/Spo0J family partition protein [Antribacter gilvus]
MATPEFDNVDPRTLTIETNIRTDADLTPTFIESIREHGVLTPILVQRTQDGTLHVRAGQRRTLAAIEAGRETVPARIIDGDGDEARRIIEQMIENDQRSALRDSDRVAGFQQLTLLGVSATKIAKTTGHKKATVTAALNVAKSQTAVAVQAKYDLTLDQAAVLAEFDGDNDAIKNLTTVAMKEPGKFEHTAQRLRDERERARRKDEARQALTEAGVTEVQAPAHDERTIRVVRDLTDDQGQRLTEETHRNCPGHAAYLASNYWEKTFTPVYVCTDYKANKHAVLGGRATGTPLSDAERAKRTEVIENNKAWRSAETVRRQWLAEFAKRKTAPKDAAVFLATALTTRDTSDLDKAGNTGHALAAEWLGTTSQLGTGNRVALRDLITKATPARAQHIALVLVLAAIEARTSTHTWRHPGNEARYLTALETWGYTLSDVEQIARGTTTADDATDEPVEEASTAEAPPTEDVTDEPTEDLSEAEAPAEG